MTPLQRPGDASTATATAATARATLLLLLLPATMLLQLITLLLLDGGVMLLLHQLAGKGASHERSSSANSVVSGVIHRGERNRF